VRTLSSTVLVLAVYIFYVSSMEKRPTYVESSTSSLFYGKASHIRRVFSIEEEPSEYVESPLLERRGGAPAPRGRARR